MILEMFLVAVQERSCSPAQSKVSFSGQLFVLYGIRFVRSPSQYFGEDVSAEKLKMYHPDFIRYLRNRWVSYVRSGWTGECGSCFKWLENEIKREAVWWEVPTLMAGKRRSQQMYSSCNFFCFFVSDSFVLMLWKPNIRTSTVRLQELWCFWLRCTRVIRYNSSLPSPDRSASQPFMRLQLPDRKGLFWLFERLTSEKRTRQQIRILTTL